ncbi:hypothetical protein NDN08_008351 [Rhodosorus marinus]|uniref:Mediator of RNA polymerase II transcription subunit 21 n=1 Tax=Rhodosorus marinus TaxID=101924 RepID=A0AAV8V193_9RHOD|nr:hypothetical protein NDN08_008351 [Rhodosorus marinus]
MNIVMQVYNTCVIEHIITPAKALLSEAENELMEEVRRLDQVHETESARLGGQIAFMNDLLISARQALDGGHTGSEHVDTPASMNAQEGELETQAYNQAKSPSQEK